ncbi:hypothetical protein [Prosthecobacter sp.]|jgi:hypothetical protein|uniref:hypothetical protein n=1 Tax=Prosthecobacter sp. TaxID=1965333 RepID=UPI0037C518C8
MSTANLKLTQKKNSGRKRGRVKGARTLDEAGYGDFHDEAVMLVHENALRLAKIPKDSEERDPQQEGNLHDWLLFLGQRVANALQRRDASLFEGIAEILLKNPPSDNGDWSPVDPARTEAAIIAMRQEEKGPKWQLPPLTTEEFAASLAPHQAAHGSKRDTNKRIAKEMGVKIIKRKGGRKPEKKRL